MPGIAAKLLFGFVLTLAAIFALLILVGLIAGLIECAGQFREGPHKELSEYRTCEE